jgi:hypothetical protein
MNSLIVFASKRQLLIEFAMEHYEVLLKHASESSPVYFRLKNAVKTEANLITVPCIYGGDAYCSWQFNFALTPYP